VHVRECIARSRHPRCVRGMVRARAAEGPTAGVGGGQALGNVDGGQRTLMARQQRVACLLRLCPYGRAPSRCRCERERERGEVQGLGGLQVGSWGPSWAAASRRLGVGGGMVRERE
jgi:hypothetical protein